MVAVPATLAIWDHVPVEEAARSIWMPSAPEVLPQYKVIADALVAVANHAKTTAEIAAANLRVGVYVLKLAACRILTLRSVQFINSDPTYNSYFPSWVLAHLA